jgi:hypothetical protein
MWIYYFLLFIFFLFSIADIAKDKYQKYFKPLLLIIIILFIGLRYNTGHDWSRYIEFFMSNLDNNISSYEPGYVLLNKIFKYVFGNYYIMQFSITCFSCLVVYNFINKYSSYKIVSLFIFISLFTEIVLMAALRQAIAISIIVLSARYIFNRKILPFIFMIFLASTFHASALFAFPLYFMYNKTSKILLILVLLFSVFLPLFVREPLLLLLHSIGPFFPGRLGLLINRYLNTGNMFFATVRPISRYTYVFAFLNIILVLCSDIKNKKGNIFFLNTLVMSVLINNLSNSFLAISRISFNYSIFNIITYTYFLNIISFKKMKELYLIYICCILLFISYPYISVFRNSNKYLNGYPVNYALVPYYNILYHPYKAQFRKDV